MATWVQMRSNLPYIAMAAEKRATAAVRKAAADIVAIAKENSRVRTGYMRSGWQSQPIDNTSELVYNLVSYTIHHEYGTIFMSAQPMMRPAIEAVMPEFHKTMAAIYKDGAGVVDWHEGIPWDGSYWRRRLT